ncbi:MAG: B12-binding domain-containing radical SAM protein, partial [Candidatus Lokiarchaeota archaeon]|nr:B12-binding domain-containing radical SAM protein [Candidatus Lokiarchaeota archaeon]
DYCVLGEGEYIFRELVDKLLRHGKKDFKDIKGIVYRENGVVKSTPRPELIKDIDEIPIPDRKLVDFNYRLQRKSSAIITSRGCPYQCRFCYFNVIMGCKWRARSVKNIVEELKMLHDQGYKEVVFGDSSFNMSMKRTRDLAAEVRKNGLDSMEFGGDLRVDRSTDEMLRLIVSMNFSKALFGIESGNQRILDYYKKGTTIEQIKLAVKKANKARMDVIFGSFIVGAPDETPAEVINTLKFANKLHLSFAAFQVLSTIPISSIYQELVDKKYHTPRDGDWKGWIFVADVCPEAVPRRVLEKLVDEAWTQFFSSYGRILRFVTRSIMSKTYVRYMLDMFQGARY